MSVEGDVRCIIINLCEQLIHTLPWIPRPLFPSILTLSFLIKSSNLSNPLRLLPCSRRPSFPIILAHTPTPTLAPKLPKTLQARRPPSPPKNPGLRTAGTGFTSRTKNTIGSYKSTTSTSSIVTCVAWTKSSKLCKSS